MLGNSLQAAAMERALSALWQKQKLIAHNLTNVETPGFKAKRQSFETAFQQELLAVRQSRELSAREKVERIRTVASRVYEDASTAVRADGNNVDSVAEQVEMARVQMHYDALRQRISSHYQTLQYAISGGR